MRAEEEFEEVYAKFTGSRPILKMLNHITSGIPRWRLHIFERGTAPNGGDMELLCIEKPTKEECLQEGTRKLKERIKSE